jgi:hypothetical protein
MLKFKEITMKGKLQNLVENPSASQMVDWIPILNN